MEGRTQLTGWPGTSEETCSALLQKSEELRADRESKRSQIGVLCHRFLYQKSFKYFKPPAKDIRRL